MRRVAGLAAYVAGEGPLVILVHGFPELWHSWANQIPAIVAAGFTVCAIDTRGNGGSDAPPAVADYAMRHMVDDLVAVADALQPDRPAMLVGHDWGAQIVWSAALTRPDRFAAVAALSIPFAGIGERSFRIEFEERFTAKNRFFYQHYFAEPGRAEAVFDADPARFLRNFYASLAGDAPDGLWATRVPADAALLDWLPEAGPPAFVAPEWFAAHVASFARTGFRGALNRYRNHDADHEWLLPWRGRTIDMPALFIGGERDPAFLLGGKADPLAAMRALVPRVEATMLPGCGHWVQQERGPATTVLLLAWLQAQRGSR